MSGGVDRDPRLSLGGSFLRDKSRGAVGAGGALVWLAFIIFPLASAVARHEPAVRHWLAVAGAVVFAASYVTLVLSWRRRTWPGLRPLLFVVLVSVACALTIAERSGWGFLFTYCSAVAAMIFPPPLGPLGVVGCAALAAVASAIGGASGGAIIGFVASSAGIGLLVLLLRDLRLRNEELIDARAELARLAVAQERERFARDLHDLLGHTLSVIALKSELAGRLLPSRVDDASREIADVEDVARRALTEVREAVSGYRQPTLDGELAGARMALSAAGIETELRRVEAPLDPSVEAVLAWAVREGATNVIRHSQATRCSVEVALSLVDARAEIVDNGVGVGAAVAGSSGAGPFGAGSRNGHVKVAGQDGHGLDGLSERAGVLGGTVEAGAGAGGGFRLSVRVPLPVVSAGSGGGAS